MTYESTYLIDAELKESIIGVFIIALIGTLFTLDYGSYSSNNIENEILRERPWQTRNFPKAQSKFSHFAAAGFFTMALLIFYTDSLRWISMKNNYAETVGTTAGKVHKGIKYSYSVNSITYSSIGNQTYPFNNSFPEVEQEGSRYIVVYDTTDPQNSLIDFNRRVGN